MLSKVLRTIRAHELVQRGERVLCAVSGGPDSIALLHALWELAARLDLRLEVATVDHGLRPESRAEGELVAARARALELPWHGLRVDVAAARQQQRASVQDAARRLRLEALEGLAARLGAARIALGHQADDQAETVLFRIVRGTGLRGLAGIPYRRGPFIRPLLDVSRAEIGRYVARRSLPFVEDPSNADAHYTRARIRHRLLPLLAEENPRVREALVALAAAARAAPRKAEGDEGDEGGEVELPNVSRRAADVIAHLRTRGGTRRIDVAGRRIVEVAYGRVSVAPATPPQKPLALATVVAAGPGTYGLGGDGPSLALSDAPGADDADGAVTFDADALAWPLALRPRRPGDRMRPRGGRGSRKLADLLIDAKVARAGRDALPVLTTADGVVLYVPGLRPSEDGRPTTTTTRFLRVRAVQTRVER